MRSRSTWRVGVYVLASLLYVNASPGAMGAPSATGSETPARNKPAGLFEDTNLVAWCVVPFDAKKRGPEERAEMLRRLGIRKLAYDWRGEHVKEFEAEILACEKHGIAYFAFWGRHPEAFALFKARGLKPQIWQTAPQPTVEDEQERVAEVGRQLLPLVSETRTMGCPLGLYNHGGWSGEPANLVALVEWLRANSKAEHVGIVYNLHHAHEHIDDFADVLALMKPYLLCLNLNGMKANADPKILPVGKGDDDARLLRTITESGYTGPIGVLDHRPDTDSELSLRENLDGVKAIAAVLTEERVTVKKSPPPIRVLVTYGGHGFKEAPFFAMFDRMKGVTYDRAVLPQSFDLLKPGLGQQYDVVVRYDMVNEVSTAQRDAFADLLKEGGIGLVALHHNLGAHRKWPEYRNIIGGSYLFDATEIDGKHYVKSTYAHWKSTSFTVVDGHHPVTRGVGPFKITDNGETYGSCYVAPGVKVLVTTDQERTTPEQLWVTQYGKTPVVYFMAGHGPEAWRVTEFQTLLKQAIEWTASRP